MLRDISDLKRFTIAGTDGNLDPDVPPPPGGTRIGRLRPAFGLLRACANRGHHVDRWGGPKKGALRKLDIRFSKELI